MRKPHHLTTPRIRPTPIGERPCHRRLPLPVEEEVADGLMSADEEARQFLQLLVNREDLELEEESVESLLDASEILQSPASATRMASMLSEWLLDQDAVADLYIDDESLAELLSQW